MEVSQLAPLHACSWDWVAGRRRTAKDLARFFRFVERDFCCPEEVLLMVENLGRKPLRRSFRSFLKPTTKRLSATLKSNCKCQNPPKGRELDYLASLLSQLSIKGLGTTGTQKILAKYSTPRALLVDRFSQNLIEDPLLLQVLSELSKEK